MGFTSQDEGRYDVVIVGAGMSAMCVAAVLANEGRRVAVVDPLPQVGGSFGSTRYNGYWLPWGHRDGHGVGDMMFKPRRIMQLAERAGITLRMENLPTYFGRIHTLAGTEHSVLDMREWSLPRRDLPGAAGIARSMVALSSAGSVPDADIDGYAAELIELVTDVCAMDDAEAWRLIPVTLGSWLQMKQVSHPVRQAFYQILENWAAVPPEEHSVGRLVTRAKYGAAEGAMVRVPVDDEIGGMQALVEAFRRRFEERGGELWLGWRPLEITVAENLDSAEVRGVVATNESSIVQTFHAPVVVADSFGWDLAGLLDESFLPPAFVAAARSFQRRAQVDQVNWMAGLTRMPTLRATGAQEDVFMHRIVGGNSSDRGYVGGFLYINAYYPAAAPPGRHLLHVWNQRGEARPYRSWADAKRTMDVLLDYLFNDCYTDLEDCLDWGRYQYKTPPNGSIWRLHVPAFGHPVNVSTVEGLYIASPSAEAPIGEQAVDLEGWIANEIVELARLERGHLWK